ncbi:hypothetical protein [Ramlibacter sp.]
MRRALWAAALAGVCGVAQAQDAAPAFEGSLGIVHRTLTERANGATLLTERGFLPQARVGVVRTLPSGAAVAAAASLAGGDVDYHGQTQAGAPLSSTTRQLELAADLLWRPLAPASWGEAWLALGWLGNRRAIESTPAAGGLDETSRAVLVGVRWVSPGFGTIAGWQAHAEVDARVSVQHHLEVDYRGLLDTSHIGGARKHQGALRLVGRQAQSPWSWEVEAARLGQSASEAAPVYRNGTLFGTVRQPALTIDDVMLRVNRRF